MTNRTIILGEVCKINSESLSSTDNPRYIHYLDTSNITRNRIDGMQLLDRNKEPFPDRAQRKVKKETIIYSTVRPQQEHYGFLENPINDMIVSTGFATINVVDEDIDPKYLYYALTRKEITEYLHTIAVNNVSSYPSIRPDDLAGIVLQIPTDKIIQEKIAAAISIMDYKIDLNFRITRELEKMAQMLHEYWFLQYDHPDDMNMPYKTTGGKMKWNEFLKKDIPDEWSTIKLFDLIDNEKTGDWGVESPHGNHNYKVNCIRGTDINGLEGTEDSTPPERYILKNKNTNILEPHDLIIEISGGGPAQSTGRMAYVTDYTLRRFSNPLICSNFCKAISLKNKKLLYNFAYYWNVLYRNNVLFNYEGKTSGIKNLLYDIFIKSCWLAIPDNKTADKYYSIMQYIQEKKQSALLENRNTSDLKEWLLPMLLNGQARICN